jgi:phosphate transport system substrate-binding protein
MKTRSTMLIGAGLTAVLALSACGSDNNNSGASPKAAGNSTSSSAAGASAAACAAGTIKGAGSSFQKPLEEQWIADFGDVCKDLKVDYQSVGSGAGKTQFGEGSIDFAGSDSTLKVDEAVKAKARCKGNDAIHIPVTAGAVVLTYNLPGVDGLQLSAPTVAAIFQGDVTKWDDAKIKADNPDAKLPSTGIQAFHRSDGSGTTKIFSTYVDKNSGGAWKLGADQELKWPASGQGAKGSEGVTAGIKQTEGGITYTELNWAKVNKLAVAKVKGSGSDFVEPTGESVSKAMASAKVEGTGNDLKVKADYTTTEAGAYPITDVTYVIVCSKGNAHADLLKSYLGYVTTTGQQVTGDLGYAALPPALAGQVKAAIDSIA